MDASALRADEGRGIAAISVGEPRAGCEPTISEWGNPITLCDDRIFSMRRAPGELKHLTTPRNRHHPRSSGERTGSAQTRAVPSRQALRRGGCKTRHAVLPHGTARHSATRRRLESVATARESRVGNSVNETGLALE